MATVRFGLWRRLHGPVVGREGHILRLPPRDGRGGCCRETLPIPHPPLQLLCEDCGYDLQAVRAASVCPECGTAVASSLPTSRPGSPWQRRRTPGGWLGTLMAMRHPRAMFRSVRIESGRAWQLLVINVVVTSVIGTVAIMAGGPLSGHASTAYALSFFGMSAGVLLALSVVEIFGIRFFGRRHGWRTDLGIATAVCGHASYGWILAGLGVAFVWQWYQWCRVLDDWASAINCPIMPSQLTPVLLGVSFFVGMLTFESLVYIGFRACRFANRPGSDDESECSDAA